MLWSNGKRTTQTSVDAPLIVTPQTSTSTAIKAEFVHFSHIPTLFGFKLSSRHHSSAICTATPMGNVLEGR
jgi:hypothetical protein